MSTLTLEYPWAWFFIPDRWNPQTRDPDFEDHTDRGYKDSDADWRAIVVAIREAVITARYLPEHGRLTTEVQVNVSPDLGKIELELATAWLGGGTTRGVTLQDEMQDGTFRVSDGRHRLWAARQAYASSSIMRERLRRLAPSLPRSRPPALPVRPEILERVVDAIRYPHFYEGRLQSTGASLSSYRTWWRVDAPNDLRRLNRHHVATLGALCRQWPNLRTVGPDDTDHGEQTSG